MTAYLTRRGRAATVMCCRCAALTCLPELEDNPDKHARLTCWVCGAQEMTVRYASTLVAIPVAERDNERPARAAEPSRGKISRVPARPARSSPQLSLFAEVPS